MPADLAVFGHAPQVPVQLAQGQDGGDPGLRPADLDRPGASLFSSGFPFSHLA
jgi:hypothetical protein